MTRQKMNELEAPLAKAIEMRRIMEHGLTCKCTSLQGYHVAQRG